MNDIQFVWSLCQYYYEQKSIVSNAIFFWEIDFQCFNVDQEGSNKISKGLASLIRDDNFTSKHMPAFLWWVRTNATLYTLNSWAELVAPRLEDAINCQHGLIYHQVTKYNGLFSKAFEEWAETEFYNDINKYDYYQSNSDYRRWRVHLINSECLLSPANDDISINFFGMPLANFLDFNEESLAERFNEKAGADLDDLLPLRDWFVYAAGLLKKISEFLYNNEKAYPTNQNALIQIIDLCGKSDFYGFPLIASNKLKEHAKHIDFTEQPNASLRLPEKIDFKCYLNNEKPSFKEISYYSQNVNGDFKLKISSQSGFSKTLAPIEYTKNLLTFGNVYEIPNWKDDYSFQIYDQNNQVVFCTNKRWSTPALFIKTNENNFWKRVGRSNISSCEITDKFKFYPTTPNDRPTITPAKEFSIEENDDGSFNFKTNTKPSRKVTISSGDYNWALVYAVEDEYNIRTSIMPTKINGTYNNQNTPVFLLGENPKIYIYFDFRTATSQKTVENKITELHLKIQFMDIEIIEVNLNDPAYFTNKVIQTIDNMNWCYTFKLVLPTLQINNNEPKKISLSIAERNQLFWILPFNKIQSSQIINPQTNSISFALENDHEVINRSSNYRWPSDFVPVNTDKLILPLAWQESNGLKCSTKLDFKFNGLWYVDPNGNGKNKLNVSELGKFLISNYGSIKICTTGPDPFLIISSNNEKFNVKLGHQNDINLQNDIFTTSNDFKNFLNNQQTSFFSITLNDNETEINSIKVSLLPIIENFSATINNNLITCETKVTHAAYSPEYLIKISQEDSQISICNLDLSINGKIQTTIYSKPIDCANLHGNIELTLVDRSGNIISGPIQITKPQGNPDLISILDENNLVNYTNLNVQWLINELNNLTLEQLRPLDFTDLLNHFNPGTDIYDLLDLLKNNSLGWPYIKNFHNPAHWNLQASVALAPNGVAFIVLACGKLITKYRHQAQLHWLIRDDLLTWRTLCDSLVSNKLLQQNCINELRTIIWL